MLDDDSGRPRSRALRYGGYMSADAQNGGTPEVVCPHCGKPFSAPLLAHGRVAQRGFKCPHCRLFVPIERAEQAG